jgi:hypothetical protein
MRRYFVVVAGLLGVLILTGANPMAGLRARVLALEEIVAGLETSSQELIEQVAALKAESDRQPVLIDANGVEVGAIQFASVEKEFFRVLIDPGVVIDLERHPLFALTWDQGKLAGQSRQLLFDSTDCSGTPLMAWEIRRPHAFRRAFHMTDGSGTTFLAPEPGFQESRFFGSILDDRGVCQGGSDATTIGPAIPVPEMEGRFTPPFQVVRRGDLAP